MNNQLTNKQIDSILRTDYKDVIKEFVVDTARRINKNENTGQVDCSIKLTGDAGYSAFKKLVKYAELVEKDLPQAVDKFITVVCTIADISNNEIYDLVRQAEIEGFGNLKLVDTMFDMQKPIHTLTGITTQDLSN